MLRFVMESNWGAPSRCLALPGWVQEFMSEWAFERSAKSVSGSTARCASIVSKILGEQLIDHIPVNIGQPKIPARMPEGKLRMIEPEEMKNGGVKIVDMHRVLGG